MEDCRILGLENLKKDCNYRIYEFYYGNKKGNHFPNTKVEA